MFRIPNPFRSASLTQKPTIMLLLAADYLGQGAPADLCGGWD